MRRGRRNEIPLHFILKQAGPQSLGSDGSLKCCTQFLVCTLEIGTAIAVYDARQSATRRKTLKCRKKGIGGVVANYL